MIAQPRNIAGSSLPGASQAGFSLLEVMIAVMVVAVAGIGLISSVLVTRHYAEYDKQRLSAIAVARHYLEQRARKDPFPAISPIAEQSIDNFNTPEEVGDDLMAELDLKLYQVNSNGTRGDEITSATQEAYQTGPNREDRIEVEVTVSWDRTGHLSGHRVSERLSTYSAPDL